MIDLKYLLQRRRIPLEDYLKSHGVMTLEDYLGWKEKQKDVIISAEFENEIIELLSRNKASSAVEIENAESSDNSENENNEVVKRGRKKS